MDIVNLIPSKVKIGCHENLREGFIRGSPCSLILNSEIHTLTRTYIHQGFLVDYTVQTCFERYHIMNNRIKTSCRETQWSKQIRIKGLFVTVCLYVHIKECTLFTFEGLYLSNVKVTLRYALKTHTPLHFHSPSETEQSETSPGSLREGDQLLFHPFSI